MSRVEKNAKKKGGKFEMWKPEGSKGTDIVQKMFELLLYNKIHIYIPPSPPSRALIFHLVTVRLHSVL